MTLQRAGVRCLLILAASAVPILLTYKYHGLPRAGIDDANIFFVYVEHLIDGQGFVYNAGSERVEGFTSLLWVLLCAPFFALLPQPEIGVLALSSVLLAATHTVATLYLDEGWLDGGASPDGALSSVSWASVSYLLLVYGSVPYVTWMTITLMDTCVWGFLIMAGLVLVLRQRRRLARDPVPALALVVLLLVLSRPEGMAIGGLFALGSLAIALSGTSRSWTLGAPAASLALAVAALTAFRLAYFGFPLPNTYYAKVSASPLHNAADGWRYLSSFLQSSPIAWLALPVLLVVLLTAAHRAIAKGVRSRWALESMTTPASICAATAAGLLLIPIATGGDHFAWWRFYQPVYPVLALLIVITAKPLTVTLRRRAVPLAPVRLAAIAGLTLVIVSPYVATSWAWLRHRQPLRGEFEIARSGLETGRVWTQVFRDCGHVPSVGVIAAGGIKREFPGEIVDLMGLNHVRMGHSPGARTGVKNHAAFSVDVFYDLAPDAVLPDHSRGAPTHEPALSHFKRSVLHDLTLTAGFRRRYTYAAITGPSSRQWATGYFRRDFLGRVDESPSCRVVPLEATEVSFGA